MSAAGHQSLPSEASLRIPADSSLRLVPGIAFALAILATLVALWLKSGVATLVFYASYLTAYAYWLSIALGALFFVALQYAARAGWSVALRRIAEHAMVTLPLFAFLSLPFLIWGSHDLYHWTHEADVAADPILSGKAGYLNLPFFWIRAAVYLLTWSIVAIYLYRLSTSQDHTGDPKVTEKLRRAAPLVIILYGITQTFAAFDWIMSLDPHWFSTMFGVYYFAGSMIAIFAFMAIVSVVLRLIGVGKDLFTAEHDHDIGKYLFGFVVFWAYIAFSQYMLYWYANIPEETMWYSHRWIGEWKVLSIVLGVAHFALPFYFLMSRSIKRRAATLLVGGIWMLAIHYVDLYWLIMPVANPEGAAFTLTDLATFVAVGGLFVGVFSLQLRRHFLVPAQDPRLGESLAHENY